MMYRIGLLSWIVKPLPQLKIQEFKKANYDAEVIARSNSSSSQLRRQWLEVAAIVVINNTTQSDL